MTEEEFKVPGWLLSTGTLRAAALLASLPSNSSASADSRRDREWA